MTQRFWLDALFIKTHSCLNPTSVGMLEIEPRLPCSMQTGAYLDQQVVATHSAMPPDCGIEVSKDNNQTEGKQCVLQRIKLRGGFKLQQDIRRDEGGAEPDSLSTTETAMMMQTH